jgi:hypothetical protein
LSIIYDYALIILTADRKAKITAIGGSPASYDFKWFKDDNITPEYLQCTALIGKIVQAENVIPCSDFFYGQKISIRIPNKARGGKN